MQKNPATKTIYILNYDHMGSVLWGNSMIQDCLNNNRQRLSDYPEFKIGWDNEAYTYDSLADGSPELLDALKKLMADWPDKFDLCTCTYGQPLSQFICEESNVRQLTLGLQTMEQRLGVSQAVYTMSEHGFHSQMPQLLLACGFKNAILRTHFTMYGYPPQVSAPIVWWVGPDGSRLPAIPTYKDSFIIGVQTGQFPMGGNTIDNRVLLDYPNVPFTLDQFRKKYEGRIAPLVASRVDDARQLEDCARDFTQASGYEWKSVKEIFALLPKPEQDFVVEPNDFRVRMPWGFSGNWIWNGVRQAEVDVLTAERLNALSLLAGKQSKEEQDAAARQLEEAWKKVLVTQHHDVEICGLDEDAHDFLSASQAASAEVIKTSLAKIGAQVGKPGAGAADAAVFNPLPWARKDWLEGVGLVEDAPGLGFKRLDSPAAGSSGADLTYDESAKYLKTPFYEVTLGDHGGFAALIDHVHGGNLLVPGKPSGGFAAVINGAYCESRGSAKVELEAGRALVTETGQIGSLAYTSRWTFYAGLPRIDWSGEFKFNGERIGQLSEDKRDAFSAFVHDQKLRMRLYPALAPGYEAVGVRDLPFMVAETYDSVIEGNYWTALSDGSMGLAVFNRGLMGSIREADRALSIPLAWSMYYVWDPEYYNPDTRRGPHILNGVYSYELGILPFYGDWQSAGLHHGALEYNFPLRKVEGWAPAGATWAPLNVAQEGTVLSALYARGDQLYARLYEVQGGSGKAAIQAAAQQEAAAAQEAAAQEAAAQPAAVQLEEVNLREQPVSWKGKQAEFAPWQIRTFHLKQ